MCEVGGEAVVGKERGLQENEEVLLNTGECALELDLSLRAEEVPLGSVMALTKALCLGEPGISIADCPNNKSAGHVADLGGERINFGGEGDSDVVTSIRGAFLFSSDAISLTEIVFHSNSGLVDIKS